MFFVGIYLINYVCVLYMPSKSYITLSKKLKKDRINLKNKMKRGGGLFNFIKTKTPQVQPENTVQQQSIQPPTAQQPTQQPTQQPEQQPAQQPPATDNTTNIEYQNNQVDLVKQAENVELAASAAGAAAGAFLVIETLSHVAVPLLAGSGFGLPIAAVLILCNKVAHQVKQNIILTNLLEYVVDILSNCYFLEKLTVKTISTFQEITSKNSPELKPYIDKMIIKSKLTLQIKAKLGILNKLITDISPDKILKENQKSSGIFGRLTKRAKRFFFSEGHAKNILRELTIINSLFIFYNSQFDWVVGYYERKLKNAKDTTGKPLLEIIWNQIENSEEFKEYLNPPVDIEEVATEVKKDVEEENLDDVLNKAQTVIDNTSISLPEEVSSINTENIVNEVVEEKEKQIASTESANITKGGSTKRVTKNRKTNRRIKNRRTRRN